jgi:flagellar basal-body rod protein FlgG
LSDKSLNTAATGMAAQQANLDTIANNLANVSTNGFKKSRAEFEDLMYHNLREAGEATGLNSISPTGVQTGLGVRTASVQRDFSYGSAIMTKNPLDLQIEGAGFFQVQTGDGQICQLPVEFICALYHCGDCLRIEYHAVAQLNNVRICPCANCHAGP